MFHRHRNSLAHQAWMPAEHEVVDGHEPGST